MKYGKKTFLGGLLAIFLGSSCCWISSLAVWLGGAGIIGFTSNKLQNFQILIVALGGTLVVFILMKNYRNYRKSD